MTTMTPDSCANLGILAMFDAMFRPAAVLASQPDDEPEDNEDPTVCSVCGGDLGDADDICAPCWEDIMRADDYGRDDRDDRVCGPLFDGN